MVRDAKNLGTAAHTVCSSKREVASTGWVSRDPERAALERIFRHVIGKEEDFPCRQHGGWFHQYTDWRRRQVESRYFPMSRRHRPRELTEALAWGTHGFTGPPRGGSADRALTRPARHRGARTLRGKTPEIVLQPRKQALKLTGGGRRKYHYTQPLLIHVPHRSAACGSGGHWSQPSRPDIAEGVQRMRAKAILPSPFPAANCPSQGNNFRTALVRTTTRPAALP
jgi:hypothetical protein